MTGGHWIELSTGISAWRVASRGERRRGGLVLAQEIFGVNAHIRALSERFAADGFDVVAPGFFDRAEKNFEAGYDADGVMRGLKLVGETSWDQVARDAQAAADLLDGPVFATGFCWGGAAAWVAACRCSGLSGAACFYGRLIVTLIDETPKVPVQLHYGEIDPTIPPADVERTRTAHPDAEVFVYQGAGHGFMCEARADHHPPSVALARERFLSFVDAHQG